MHSQPPSSDLSLSANATEPPLPSSELCDGRGRRLPEPSSASRLGQFQGCLLFEDIQPHPRATSGAALCSVGLPGAFYEDRIEF